MCVYSFVCFSASFVTYACHSYIRTFFVQINALLLLVWKVIYLKIWRRRWDLLEGLGEFPDTMAAYEHIDEYRLGQDWDEYVRRLEQYFIGKLIDGAAQKRAVFLTVCGSRTYK